MISRSERTRVFISEWIEVIPSTGYTSSALAAGATDILTKCTVTNGRGYFKGCRLAHRSTNLNENAEDLELALRVDGGSWTDFQNLKAARDTHLLGPYENLVKSLTDDAHILDPHSVQKITTTVLHGAAAYRILAGYTWHPPGTYGNPFTDTFEVRAENKEGALGITITGFFICCIREEKATFTWSHNP